MGCRRYARIVYSVKIPITGYEDRTIEMHFRRVGSEPMLVRVYTDGPTESPHRFRPDPRDQRGRSSLCIWYETDPPERRWLPEDGLLSLIEMTRIHLFKEAYWRETGEWLGGEAPHESQEAKAC